MKTFQEYLMGEGSSADAQKVYRRIRCMPLEQRSEYRSIQLLAEADGWTDLFEDQWDRYVTYLDYERSTASIGSKIKSACDYTVKLIANYRPRGPVPLCEKLERLKRKKGDRYIHRSEDLGGGYALCRSMNSAGEQYSLIMGPDGEELRSIATQRERELLEDFERDRSMFEKERRQKFC